MHSCFLVRFACCLSGRLSYRFLGCLSRAFACRDHSRSHWREGVRHSILQKPGVQFGGQCIQRLLIGFIGYRFGYRAVFFTAAFFSIPSLIALAKIKHEEIDYARARGATTGQKELSAEGIGQLLQDRRRLLFLGSRFLFSSSNAAMLPQLGELLLKGNPRRPPTAFASRLLCASASRNSLHPHGDSGAIDRYTGSRRHC
jgi:hypothetical protein